MTVEKKLRIAFLGTPEIVIPTLEMLSTHPNVDVCTVISMPDRPAGRGQELKSPPVALFAANRRIPLFQTENINKDQILIEKLKELNLDFILVFAFAQFLSQKILNISKLGAFNIHTSILPKYRGAAPIHYALLNRDSQTGVSIQKMVKKMDAGDVVISEIVSISQDDDFNTLSLKLANASVLATKNFIRSILENDLKFTKQNELEVSFAPTLKKEDGLLDFKNSTIKKIMGQIHAFSLWPSTYCFLNGARLKVFKVEVWDHLRLPPGEVSIAQGHLLVGALDGVLRLVQVQMEGKKVCQDTDILNGLKNKGGNIVINNT